MSSEKLLAGGDCQIQPPALSSSHSFREATRIFDELPKATIVSVSKPDASDFSPLLLSYTIELQYKHVSFLSLSLSIYIYICISIYIWL